MGATLTTCYYKTKGKSWTRPSSSPKSLLPVFLRGQDGRSASQIPTSYATLSIRMLCLAPSANRDEIIRRKLVHTTLEELSYALIGGIHTALSYVWGGCLEDRGDLARRLACQYHSISRNGAARYPPYHPRVSDLGRRDMYQPAGCLGATPAATHHGLHLFHRRKYHHLPWALDTGRGECFSMYF